MSSLYQEYVVRWSGCTACTLCETRKHVVLARGSVPADVVFIGEAPGQSEDVLGRPFVGPAGRLLDQIITDSVQRFNCERLARDLPLVTYALTNLVACIPLEPDDRTKLAQPEHDSIKACQPRLVKFVRMCQPRVLVLLGSLAQSYVYGQSLFSTTGKKGRYSLEWLAEGEFMRFVQVVHPAAILRGNVAQRGLSVRRCVVNVYNTLCDVWPLG